MEEKKKRFRPTLGAYRELEAKVKAQEELIDKLKCVGKAMVTEGESITTQLNILAKGSDWAEEYRKLWEKHKNLSARYSELNTDYENMKKRCEWLLNRGLWDRITNKKRGN